jgi:hypothetical protein
VRLGQDSGTPPLKLPCVRLTCVLACSGIRSSPYFSWRFLTEIPSLERKVRSWGFPRLGSFHGRETRPDELRKWSTLSREECPKGGVGRSPQPPHYQLPTPNSQLPTLNSLNETSHPRYHWRIWTDLCHSID